MATSRADIEVDAAREVCYHFFALATADPRSRGWSRLADAGFQEIAGAAAAFLSEEAAALEGALAPGERPPASIGIGSVVELVRQAGDGIAAEHQRIFGFLLSKDCPPYESEYCPQTFSIYRSHQLGDVAGYYKAFGLAPSREMPERHDHVSLEMELMAWLIGKERYALRVGGDEADERAAVCRDVQVSFLRDHVCWWVPAFAKALEKKAEGTADVQGRARTFYGRLAHALASFVAFDRLYLGIEAPTRLVSANPVEDTPEMTCGGCEAATAS